MSPVAGLRGPMPHPLDTPHLQVFPRTLPPGPILDSPHPQVLSSDVLSDLPTEASHHHPRMPSLVLNVFLFPLVFLQSPPSLLSYRPLAFGILLRLSRVLFPFWLHHHHAHSTPCPGILPTRFLRSSLLFSHRTHSSPSDLILASQPVLPHPTSPVEIVPCSSLIPQPGSLPQK